jgi:single-strand DNA-binding protein
MVNKVILIGNLGADAEVTTLESGVTVARLNIATTESYFNKEKNEWTEVTEWHSGVEVWRNKGAAKARKGDRVYVEGKLKTEKWQDKEGKDRWTTKVVVNGRGFQSLFSKNSDGGSSGPLSDPLAVAGNGFPNVQEVSSVAETVFPEGSEDNDLPF